MMSVGKDRVAVEGTSGATPIHVEIDYVDHASTHHSGGGDQVDHNLLFNYVVAQHIDWSVTGAEDVHIDRIPVGSIDHDSLLNYVAAEHINWTITGAEDVHIDRIPVGSIDHDLLLNYVAGEHFTEASIDHVNILNKGTNTHAQIDTHISDTSIHFSEGSIDHNNIANNGSNTHAAIDGHLSSTSNPHSVTAAQAGAIPTAEKGAANGVATLDVGTKIPIAQIPAEAKPDFYVVADVTARLALTVQEGDEAKQLDDGSHWIYDGTSWHEYPTGTNHAPNHVTGAGDEVDGDKLDIDWNPTNYAPDTSPTEVDNVDNLTAHLKGIDDALDAVSGAVSVIINPGDWVLDTGNRYYYDFTHNLGTQDLVFQARNHTLNEVIRVWDWVVQNDNAVRVYIYGNTSTVRAIAATGRGPQGPTGPQGPAGGGLANVVEDLTPELGGNLGMNGFDIEFKVPTANGGSSGFVVTGTVDTNATGLGAALYMASDGNFDEADADAASTGPCRALALETGTGSKKLLLKGFLRVDAWGWTPGGDLYISTTTGALTHTAPIGDTDQVQKVGFAWDADTIYFSPGDYTIVEVDD